MFYIVIITSLIKGLILCIEQEYTMYKLDCLIPVVVG